MVSRTETATVRMAKVSMEPETTHDTSTAGRKRMKMFEARVGTDQRKVSVVMNNERLESF